MVLLVFALGLVALFRPDGLALVLQKLSKEKWLASMKTFFFFSLVDDGCDHLCLNKPSVFNRFRSFHCYLSFSRQGMKQIFTTISSRFPEFHHPQPLNQWHLAMYHKVDLSLRRDETVVIKCFLIYHLKVPPKWFSTNELVKSTIYTKENTSVQ